MSNKRIFYTLPNGRVCVVIPAPKFVDTFDTEADGIAAILVKDIPSEATNIFEGNITDLPYRGNLRNAWRQSGTIAPVMDMPIARNLKMNHLRVTRDKKLKDLDVLSVRADEDNDGQERAAIILQKQALRDMPTDTQSDLNAITDPETLDNFTPDVLQ